MSDPRPSSEIAEDFVSELTRAPLVRCGGDGYFEFLLDNENAYDFTVGDPSRALRWIEHMAQKSWVTKEHLEQFARLAADKFGGSY